MFPASDGRAERAGGIKGRRRGYRRRRVEDDPPSPAAHRHSRLLPPRRLLLVGEPFEAEAGEGAIADDVGDGGGEVAAGGERGVGGGGQEDLALTGEVLAELAGEVHL